jgi:hypothetical protein
MVANEIRLSCVALGCGKPRRNPTYRLLQLCLGVVLLAACATPDCAVVRDDIWDDATAAFDWDSV